MSNKIENKKLILAEKIRNIIETKTGDDLLVGLNELAKECYLEGVGDLFQKTINTIRKSIKKENLPSENMKPEEGNPYIDEDEIEEGNPYIDEDEIEEKEGIEIKKEFVDYIKIDKDFVEKDIFNIEDYVKYLSNVSNKIIYYITKDKNQEEKNKLINYFTEIDDQNDQIDINYQDSTKIKKIYLAIPYTGMEEKSYEFSVKFAALIMKENKQINVFSPIINSHPLTKFGTKGNWDYWKNIDYQYIDWCDELWVCIPKVCVDDLLYTLRSIGVTSEIIKAKEQGKLIKFITIDDKEKIKFI